MSSFAIQSKTIILNNDWKSGLIEFNTLIITISIYSHMICSLRIHHNFKQIHIQKFLFNTKTTVTVVYTQYRFYFVIKRNIYFFCFCCRSKYKMKTINASNKNGINISKQSPRKYHENNLYINEYSWPLSCCQVKRFFICLNFISFLNCFFFYFVLSKDILFICTVS